MVCAAVLLNGSVESASAKTASKAGSTGSSLVLVAPTEPVQMIQLEPLPATSGDYVGHLTITVKNKGARPGRVAVGYLQANGARFNALADAEGSPVGPAAPIADPPPILRPGQLRPLQLEFQLPGAEPASWLDGTLLLRLRKVGRKGTASAPTLVPVKAEFLPLTGITFEPNPLTLQVTGGDLEGGGTVNLVGPGVGQLLGRSPSFEATVLVGNDEGSRASVTIDEFRRVGEGTVAGKLSVDGAEPGEYTGTLTLGPGPSAPSLPITLHARLCIFLAIGLILLSSLVGGLLPAFSAIARTRALLRIKLKTAIERLEEQYDIPENSPRLLWDMTVTMGQRPWLSRGWRPVAQVDGVAGLYTELRWARSEDELEELGTAVDEAVGEIGRWLLVFERAKKLHALLARPGVPERKGVEWRATEIATGAEEFLDGLSRETPETDKDARALVKKCDDRLQWYALVLEAWTKIASAERDSGLSDTARTALGEKDLSPFTTVDFPTPAQRAPLGARLTRLMREVIALAPEFDWSADDPSAKTLDAFAASATRPGRGYPDLLTSAGDEPEPLGAEGRLGTQKWTGEQTLQGLSALDWLVTGALALGATLAYTVPLYDSTWGTTADLLAALAAGFGTQVVVRWAAMPIFRSIRTSKADSDAGKTMPEEGLEPPTRGL